MDFMMTLGIVLFWTSLALVFYAYVGYSVTIWCLARWLGQRREPPLTSVPDLPSVSLLIAAYNEEDVIEKRARSALAMDYPADKLEVVIASDGSTDRTAAIVRALSRYQVRLLEYPRRRGKAAVLNASCHETRGQIVVFSDAHTQIDPSALRKIVRWFADPEIGVVYGRLILTDPRTGRNADGIYWKYETFLKRSENRLDALLGGSGAIYAIRRELYSPIPEQTILDDFVIPLYAKLRTGCRIVYDYEATARESTSPSIRGEFHRRSRLGAGGFQCIPMLWRLLNPLRGWIAFSFVSHKVLRWLCPFFLVTMLASSLLLSSQPFYRSCLLAQIGFYLVSVLLAYVPARFRALKPLWLTTMFTSLNVALLVGFCRWLLSRQQVTWERTKRLVEVESDISRSGANS